MNGHPKIQEFPDRPPPLELCVARKEDSGKVHVEIINRENNKTTTRVYDSMSAAEKMAGFIAASLGIDTSNPAVWLPWLRERGFSGISYLEAVQRTMRQQREAKESEEKFDEDGDPIINAENINPNFMR